MKTDKKQNLPRLRDGAGEWVTAGDTIRFTFGLPPIVAFAKIIERDGKLIALTPTHNPPECNLRSLRRYVGYWFKEDKNND